MFPGHRYRSPWHRKASILPLGSIFTDFEINFRGNSCLVNEFLFPKPPKTRRKKKLSWTSPPLGRCRVQYFGQSRSSKDAVVYLLVIFERWLSEEWGTKVSSWSCVHWSVNKGMLRWDHDWGGWRFVFHAFSRHWFLSSELLKSEEVLV